MNQYEAMFLFDPTFGSTFENCESEVRRLMERAKAKILLLRQWDERRLAYRIKGRKRGVYVLVYFEAEPDKITPLERDAKLAENVLRIMVVRAEGVTPEMMDKALAARGEMVEEGSSKAAEGSPKAEEGPPKVEDGPPEVEVSSGPAAEEAAEVVSEVAPESAVEVDVPEPEALVAEVATEDPPADEPASDAPLS